MSGLSCGVLFLDSKWPIYDVLLGLPLAAMFNAMCVFTTIMVTFGESILIACCNFTGIKNLQKLTKRFQSTK
jgi:uncharacterized membrane protein